MSGYTNHQPSKKTWLKTAIAAVAVSCVLPAVAGTVMIKPGAQDTYAPEFGRELASFGSYTTIAAMQESAFIPSEPTGPGGIVGGQGVIYLFNGANTVPERTYQFAGNAHFKMGAGAKVALSNKWLAFTAEHSEGIISSAPSAVYIVGKSNNQWLQCPTISGVLDCTSLVGNNGVYPAPAIIKIPFSEKLHFDEMSIAISDNYLVMANSKSSKVSIYKYDTSSQQWLQEYNHDDLDERHYGRAVSLDGDRIAISAPFASSVSGAGVGVEKGTVRILSRNAATSTWDITGSNYGYFTEGNFGRALALKNNNLIVSSGADAGPNHIVFYRVNGAGELSTPLVMPVDFTPKRVAIEGDVAVVNTWASPTSLQLYKRDASASGVVWNEGQSLNGSLYASAHPTGLYFPGYDAFSIVGDDIVMGWRGLANLVGGVVREKISLIDSCKNPQNLIGSNCSFDVPTSTDWQFLTHMGAAASPNYAGGQIKTTIYYAGSDMWHIQLRRTVALPATQNYQLSFRAKADNARAITVNLGHNGSQDNNWQSYSREVVSLDTEWATYTYTFASVPADTNAVLDFNLGDEGNDAVTIDSVSLTPIAP